jgi:hypothetical protein
MWLDCGQGQGPLCKLARILAFGFIFEWKKCGGLGSRHVDQEL